LDDERNALRPFRAGYWFGGFNGLTWMMTFGTPMVLLLERLGASTLQVGLVTSSIFILYPVQVLATATLARLGFQRQMVIAWTLRAFFLLVPLGIAFAAPEHPASWMPTAVVAAVYGFCFFRAFGVACHVPWFAGILPDGLRGRFFATEQALTSGVGVVALLTCAGLFAALPPYPVFRIVYSIALFGSAMAVVNLLRLPPGPRPAPSPVREMGPAAVRFCLRPGLFRQFLIITAIGSIVGSSFGAFTIYYLKTEAGISASEVLAFTAAQFGGQILANWAMRRFIDRVAIRRFFQIGSGVIALVFAYWLGIVNGEAGWLAFVGVSYFVVGTAVGVNNSAYITFLPELAPIDRRPIAIAVFGGVSGVLQGLGPMLWGLALRTGGDAPGVDRASFAVFFALGIAFCVVSLWLLRSLPDTRSGMRAAA
jgi:MFS family permease